MTTTQLHFVMIASLRGFIFNPERPNGLAFSAPEPAPVNLTLKPKRADDDGSGLWHGLECRSYVSKAVCHAQFRFAEQLIAGRFELYSGAPIRLPHIEHGEEAIDASGNVRKGFMVPFELYPPDLQLLCDSVRTELRSGIERLIKLLRWQQEIDGPHSVFEYDPSLYWRVEDTGKEYRTIPERRHGGEGRSPAGIQWDEVDQLEFAALWATNANEPLGHELLREAGAVLDGSPRSALLMAASAVEAGVKAHIGRIAPDTEWLLSELPSPPTHRLLRRYIPLVHRRQGNELKDWSTLKPLFNAMEQLAQHRNDLTHTGAVSDEATQELPGLLNAASDMLYILDVLEGHEWAKGNVQASTRKLLGWPSPRRQRYRWKVLVPDYGVQDRSSPRPASSSDGKS